MRENEKTPRVLKTPRALKMAADEAADLIRAGFTASTMIARVARAYGFPASRLASVVSQRRGKKKVSE